MAFQRIAAYVAAVLFAALAATVLAVGISGPVKLMPLALGIAVCHAALLGLPLFLLFRWKGWDSALSSACAGFVIGAVPVGAITFPWRGQGRASIDGTATLIDGVPTLAGWLYYGQLLVLLGLLGAFAGVVFCLTLNWSGQLRPATQKTGGSRLPAQGPVLPRRAVPLAAIALLLTGTVAAIPSITKDRTCHNAFRDGRSTRVTPQANIRLDIGLEEWTKLIGIFETFGATHNLSFRNTSQSNPGVAEMLYISLCNEQGVKVSVIDQRWASRNYDPLIKGGTHLHVYELRAGSGWERIAQALVNELEAAWPGRVHFFSTQTDRSDGTK